MSKHEGERKSSISLHVADSKKSHTLFAAGHFIGGLAFMVFAYRFFYVQYGSSTVLLIAIIGFIVEQVQAFLPNNEKFEKVHTVAAFGMGLSMLVILALAPAVVQLTSGWLTAYIVLAFIYVAAGVYACLNRQKFYQSQLVFFSAFYLFLLVLVYGGVSK